MTDCNFVPIIIIIIVVIIALYLLYQSQTPAQPHIDQVYDPELDPNLVAPPEQPTVTTQADGTTSPTQEGFIPYRYGYRRGYPWRRWGYNPYRYYYPYYYPYYYRYY